MTRIAPFSLIFLLIFSQNIMATDSLKNSLEVLYSGIEAQNERINTISQNMSNQETLSDKPGGNPYRRQIVIFKNIYDKKKKAKLIRAKIKVDKKSPFKVMYEPENLVADEKGYVKYPNITKEIELYDLSEAQQSSKALLSATKVTRQMISDTIDLIKK